MFAKRYRPDELIEIIAAQSYSPEIVAYVKKVANQPTLANYLKSKPKLGVTGTIAKDYVEATTPNAVPYISTKQVKGLHAYIEDAKYISKEADIEWKKCRVDDGDIVINKSGDVGAAAVLCCAPYKYVNSVSDIISIKLSETAPVDRDFLVVYLNSPYGQKQLQRLSGGAIFSHVSLHAIPHINVYAANVLAQKYIGDKVRQAERLRAWAKELRSSVDEVLDQLGLPTADEPAMINRVSTERLETRLDPRPYRTHYINLVDRIKAIKHSYVSEVAELASGCPVSSNDFIEGGEVPLVRIRNIGFDEFIDLDTGVTKELHKDEAKYQAKENMIVLGMDGIFRTQFFLSDELPMLVNQRVGMLTANDIRAELLTHWLNRPEGQMQLNQWAVKTTVEHTSLSDIGRVRIPRLEADVEADLANKLLGARRAYRYSRFLTTSAKLLVEALIEGRLTEAELLAAEKALQAGNDRLDRLILSRLNTDGIDGQGPALFGDLDELYHLLTQAEGD